MKLPTKQSRQFAPTIGKIMTALAFASVLSITSMAPAIARVNDDHHDNGRHEGKRHHEGNYYHGRSGYYPAPVYSAPPAYYAPQQSPGISLFFPLDFRR